MNKPPESDFDPNLQVSARALGLYNEIAKRAESSGRCVFCNLKDKYIICEHNDWVLTANLFPRSTGDLVIIPRRHIVTQDEFIEGDAESMVHLGGIGRKLLERGVNIRATYFLFREGSETDKTVSHFHAQLMAYRKGLVKWNPQQDMLEPAKLAQILRETNERLKSGEG